ncbi:glycosyltransferase [Bosea sp. TND4EK4]|uniref:glycosyltransferase n=1 Tax=Bosea sp. TND4EK4 TaxID=1907408 RepID=UPI0011156A19|nr:glycosyltransferase [Bosea sp. TND4EK4]
MALAESFALDEGVCALKPRIAPKYLEVVSITPLALRADSRTLKQTASVYRLGYKSAVVEGKHSGFDPGSLPFEVLSVEVPRTEVPPATAPAKEDEEAPSRLAATEVCDTSGLATSAEAGTLRHSISRGLAELRRLRKQDRAAAFRFAAWSAIRLGQRAGYRAPIHAYYFVLWSASFARIKLNIAFNKLYYNNFTAFIYHILGVYRNIIQPTRAITPGAKLYYLHSPYQFPAIAFRCLTGKARYIYDAHDFYSHMDDHTRLPSFWTRWVVPWENMIERWCVRHASAVVTVNQGIAELMKKRFGRDVVVLRNAHDPRLEGAPGTTLRTSLGLAEDALLTVCIGQWKRDTAIAQAMQAFATLPDHHHLAFLGANFPSYAAQIAELGIEGRVHFHPAVKANEVVPFVRSADFGLLLYHPVSPSIRHCLPNGFFQPLAAGLPVLYPDLPEIVRVAGPLDLGLQINPLDPKSIAEAVLCLGSDSSLRASKKANVEAARDELSWERDEEVLKRLIEDLIGPPHAA